MDTHHYFKLYKPYGYISQFITNDKHARRKKFLGTLYDFPEGTMAVGRLDENSEGLLLLTTDGGFSHNISKGKKVEKEYYVQVDGMITSDAIKMLQQGLEISINGKNYQTKPCKATMIETPSIPPTSQRIRDDRHGPTSWIALILKEGKFRQVRKMTAAVGFPTLRLVRVRIGSYTIENMECGSVKKITPTNFL
ncbi:pseudouridine synthase [Jejudonia soesokkakensis]|uniref:Pseudouridine synthase n=1 Tax=Jejudonia soesokkakensis TaxID=1323432 RepID=A0ABW2MSF0_9FLAO